MMTYNNENLDPFNELAMIVEMAMELENTPQMCKKTLDYLMDNQHKLKTIRIDLMLLTHYDIIFRQGTIYSFVSLKDALEFMEVFYQYVTQAFNEELKEDLTDWGELMLDYCTDYYHFSEAFTDIPGIEHF